uniref:G-protein coupled receptors family 1 profile domain-containing protein n=1 Tax=Cyprinus carpio carpio TaxID=630221 RepID=A0A9J7Y874_CYPCA
MENGTYFYLMLFENIGYIRYAFFGLGIILYCAIVFFNALIILAIFLERILHQPMYILISCLSVNSVFGTAAFFPRLLTDLLSDSHSVSREACILQAFVIYSYATNENTILMLMAFDRYIAISKPLQYNNIMQVGLAAACGGHPTPPTSKCDVRSHAHPDTTPPTSKCDVNESHAHIKYVSSCDFPIPVPGNPEVVFDGILLIFTVHLENGRPCHLPTE